MNIVYKTMTRNKSQTTEKDKDRWTTRDLQNNT